MLTCGTETEKTKRYSSNTTAADSQTIIPTAKANVFEARGNDAGRVHLTFTDKCVAKEQF